MHNSKLNTLNDLRNSRHLASILRRVANATLVGGLLRRYFLLRFLEFLPFLDTMVSYGLGALRRKAFIGQDGSGRGTLLSVYGVVLELDAIKNDRVRDGSRVEVRTRTA